MRHYSIVVKSKAFAEDFLPDDTPGREKEVQRIQTCLGPALKHRAPLHVWLHGASGSGKTVVSRRILQGWSRETTVEAAYVNCWRCNTLYKVAEALVDSLSILRAEPHDTGFKLERIRRHLAGNLLLVVLDEIDQALPRDRGDIIRGLCGLGSVGLICISRNIGAFYALGRGVRSRLAPQIIRFKPYSDRHLEQVLTDRAQASLAEGSWTRSLLSRIARLARGDARTAIQALRSVAEFSDQERSPVVRGSDVRKACSDVHHEPTDSILSGLTEDHRLLYEIIKEHGRVVSGELYRCYEDRSRSTRRKPIALRTFSNYANRLVRTGLVTCERARLKGKVRLFRVA